MNKSLLTTLRLGVIAFVLFAISSTSFAAVDMFLQIKDLKGKVVSRCPVSSDGSFECPALPAGEYTASLEWSWGASNPSTASGSGSGMGAGKVNVQDISFTKNTPHTVMFNYTIKSPRDAASGQASGKRDAASGQASGRRDAASGLPTGKRQHKPMSIVVELDKSTPQMRKQLDKSSPTLAIGTINVDEDCDGITGKVSCKNDGGKHIDIESWSWGVSNR